MGTCAAYEVGQSGSGSPSSHTNTATEKTIIPAASARTSSSRTSRAALAPMSTSTATAAKISPAQKSVGERTRITCPCGSGKVYSIRSDIRLLDDGAEALRRLFHAGVQLRRARGDGIDAPTREALLDVGHSEDLQHFPVQLVDHWRRSAL